MMLVLKEKQQKNGFSVYLFPNNAYPSAKVLARFSSPVAIKGNPAVFEFKIGKGRVLLFSQYPQVDDTAFWYGICEKLGIERRISFAGKNTDRDIYLPWTNGYLSAAEDGSYLISTIQHPNQNSYRFTWRPATETPPIFRRVKAHGLRKGNYRVEMFKGGKKTELGIFSSGDIDKKGIPYTYSKWNEVIAFYLEPEKIR